MNPEDSVNLPRRTSGQAGRHVTAKGAPEEEPPHHKVTRTTTWKKKKQEEEEGDEAEEEEEEITNGMIQKPGVFGSSRIHDVSIWRAKKELKANTL